MPITVPGGRLWVESESGQCGNANRELFRCHIAGFRVAQTLD